MEICAATASVSANNSQACLRSNSSRSKRSLDSQLGQYTVFDFNLNDTTHLLKLKDKLKSRPKDAKVIFVTEKTSRLQETRALAIGATDVIHRPVDGRALLAKIWSEARSLAEENPKFAENERPGRPGRGRHASRHLFRSLQRRAA